jgi:hypothetical protein
MNTWQDEVHFDVLPLELLREQLQENLLTHLDFCKTLINLDHVCQVVVDTFKEFEV